MYALEKKKGWRIDLSFNGIASQSKETAEVLKQLEAPVQICALFRKGKRIIGMLEDRAEYFKPYPSEKTITQEEVAWLKSLKPPTADVREEAYNKGHDDGVKETLADLEAEWKHGYDFAKKEDKK